MTSPQTLMLDHDFLINCVLCDARELNSFRTRQSLLLRRFSTSFDKS